MRWFDLIGMQRHIKVLGIFARLWYRDGKPGYLRDLPLTLEYVRDTAWRYPELESFASWLSGALCLSCRRPMHGDVGWGRNYSRSLI